MSDFYLGWMFFGIEFQLVHIISGFTMLFIAISALSTRKTARANSKSIETNKAIAAQNLAFATEKMEEWKRHQAAVEDQQKVIKEQLRGVEERLNKRITLEMEKHESYVLIQNLSGLSQLMAASSVDLRHMSKYFNAGEAPSGDVTGNQMLFMISWLYQEAFYYQMNDSINNDKPFNAKDHGVLYTVCTTEAFRKIWPFIKHFISIRRFTNRIDMTLKEYEDKHTANI